MDSAVGNYGSSLGRSAASTNSLNNQVAKDDSTTQNSLSPENMTTGERIASTPTTEERLRNTPSTAVKPNAATETSTDLADETKQVQATWESLRSYPEIKAIEEKVGKIKLTVDYTKKTGYNADENEIIINPAYVKNTPYKTVINESIENSLAKLPDKDYWEFMDNYPESYPFSFERQLVHEAHHALQPDYQLLYDLNPSQFEAPVIQETNEFMWNNFKEPARDPNWH